MRFRGNYSFSGEGAQLVLQRRTERMQFSESGIGFGALSRQVQAAQFVGTGMDFALQAFDF